MSGITPSQGSFGPSGSSSNYQNQNDSLIKQLDSQIQELATAISKLETKKDKNSVDEDVLKLLSVAKKILHKNKDSRLQALAVSVFRPVDATNFLKETLNEDPPETSHPAETPSTFMASFRDRNGMGVQNASVAPKPVFTPAAAAAKPQSILAIRAAAKLKQEALASSEAKVNLLPEPLPSVLVQELPFRESRAKFNAIIGEISQLNFKYDESKVASLIETFQSQPTLAGEIGGEQADRIRYDLRNFLIKNKSTTSSEHKEQLTKIAENFRPLKVIFPEEVMPDRVSSPLLKRIIQITRPAAEDFVKESVRVSREHINESLELYKKIKNDPVKPRDHSRFDGEVNALKEKYRSGLKDAKEQLFNVLDTYKESLSEDEIKNLYFATSFHVASPSRFDMIKASGSENDSDPYIRSVLKEIEKEMLTY